MFTTLITLDVTLTAAVRYQGVLTAAKGTLAHTTAVVGTKPCILEQKSVVCLTCLM